VHPEHVHNDIVAAGFLIARAVDARRISASLCSRAGNLPLLPLQPSSEVSRIETEIRVKDANNGILPKFVFQFRRAPASQNNPFVLLLDFSEVSLELQSGSVVK